MKEQSFTFISMDNPGHSTTRERYPWCRHNGVLYSIEDGARLFSRTTGLGKRELVSFLDEVGKGMYGHTYSMVVVNGIASSPKRIEEEFEITVPDGTSEVVKSKSGYLAVVNYLRAHNRPLPAYQLLRTYLADFLDKPVRTAKLERNGVHIADCVPVPFTSGKTVFARASIAALISEWPDSIGKLSQMLDVQLFDADGSDEWLLDSATHKKIIHASTLEEAIDKVKRIFDMEVDYKHGDGAIEMIMFEDGTAVVIRRIAKDAKQRVTLALSDQIEQHGPDIADKMWNAKRAKFGEMGFGKWLESKTGGT